MADSFSSSASGSPSVPGDPAPSIRVQVEAELTRLLYRSAGFGLFSNIALAVLLLVGTWSDIDHGLSLIWFSLLLVAVLYRIAHHRAFFKKSWSHHELPLWRRRFLIGLSMTGILWRWGAWHFLSSESLLTRILTTLMLAGLNAGAARALASVKPAYIVYALTTLGPVFFRFFTYGATANPAASS
ncbi:MAG: hypothetical protein J6386_17765 [Candidatus Synoicihabitans palmerolidicus]|nr:hypothetical protein [Candidatus Synoicihabitans palmerolidicus]